MEIPNIHELQGVHHFAIITISILTILCYLVLKPWVGWFSEQLQPSCCFPQRQNEEIWDLQSEHGRETVHSTWGSECSGGWALCGNGSCPGAYPAHQPRYTGFLCCYLDTRFGRRQSEVRKKGSKSLKMQKKQSNLCPLLLPSTKKDKELSGMEGVHGY